MTLLHTSDFLRIHADENRAVLETEWLDYAGGDALRQGLNQALALARARQVRGWVANQQRMRTIRPADQQWISDYFMPALARLPLRRLGLVVAADALNRMAVKALLQRASGIFGGEIQSFDTVQEARTWVGAAAAIARPAER